MSQRQGMDAAAVQSLAAQLSAQSAGLSNIAGRLRDIENAARFPSMYGIEPGEMTVAPWSIDNIDTAQALLGSAESSISTLVGRLQAEIDQQLSASNSDYASAPGSIVGIPGTPGTPQNPGAPRAPGEQVNPAAPGQDDPSLTQQVLTARSEWFARPRSLLDLPGAVYSLAKDPSLGRFGIRDYFSPSYAVTQGAAMKAVIGADATPQFIKNTYLAAANMKFQNLMDPAFNHTKVGPNFGAAPSWLDKFHLPAMQPGVVSNAVANTKLIAAGAGKGFAVLGVASGVMQLADGLSGKGDGWDTADGIVNIVTGIGSFAPPPVGLVFAGVGAAYNVGRWLFSGAEGERPADHIANFAKDVGKGAATIAANNVKATVEAVQNTAKVAGAAIDVAGKVLDKVWPW